jgi:nitroreductase
MDLISAIKERRSVRRFLEKEIDMHTVKEIIRSGTFAPTACNRQAWRFIVVTDKKIKASLRDKGGSSIIFNSPVGVLVLYNTFTDNLEYPDNIESASACMQNMLLAATHFGLGSSWINNLPNKAFLHKFFKIPKRYDIIGYIALGYSAPDVKQMPRKYSAVDELISYNKFEMKKEIEKRKSGKLVARITKIFLPLYRISPKIVKKLFKKNKQKIVSDYFRPDHSEN